MIHFVDNDTIVNFIIINTVDVEDSIVWISWTADRTADTHWLKKFNPRYLNMLSFTMFLRCLWSFFIKL